ncbi:hypothetical protein HMPREF9246_0125 [Anaerococcus hydrogenalis ACS-025-V-Sch4]|uniref:Uncharacterized protein n=1 Tax=Anaerococcus hydrogenalis ACS-025-V-Sch4 TaxID=879306 RepID=F0H326_9FIRM|nr:hypothetical protein HMPREF9246_0125 [Anaerococcus hydrogenalis ACS-025-V-Sch4]
MKFKRLLITLLTVATVYFGSNLFLNRLENKKTLQIMEKKLQVKINTKKLTMKF